MAEENINNNEDLREEGQNIQKEGKELQKEEQTVIPENSSKKVEVDNSKFVEKASAQVNRIFKDLETMAFHGSKSGLSDETIEKIISEIREHTNLARKQFSTNTAHKDFENLTSHVSKVTREIKALGELSNKHAGEYGEEHVDTIFDAMKKKTNEAKKTLKVKDKKDDKFSF